MRSGGATERFVWRPGDIVEEDAPMSGKSAIAVPFDSAVHPRDWHGRFARKPGSRHRPAQWLRQQLGINWLGRHMTSSGLRRRGFDATPLALLVTTSHRDMDDYAASPLGRLLVPGNWSRADESQHDGVVVAADNGGFWGVDEPAYKHMCEKLKSQGVTPVWVTVPDVLHHLDDGTVVGDAKATQQRFEQWKQYLDHLGFPAAFVAQDGADSPENLAWLEQHWDDIAAIFIGGSDAFKLGPGAAKIGQLAHEHGKIVHTGRVNSAMRLAYCRDVVESDSCDGKQWAEFKKLKLADGLDFIPSGDAPPTKMAQRWIEAALLARDTGAPWPRPPWQGHSWMGYFGEPLPETASDAAKQFYGHFTDEGTFIKALTTTVYYEPLADALAMVGLSDYWHLEIDSDFIGFAVTHETDVQLQRFIKVMGLPAPAFEGKTARWSNVLVRPSVEGEDEGKAFDPDQPRWPRGSPRAGQWRPKLNTQAPRAAADFEKLMGTVRSELDGIRRDGAETDSARLQRLGLQIDGLATSFSTIQAYRTRRNAIKDEIDAHRKEGDDLAAALDEHLKPSRIPPEYNNRTHEYLRLHRAEGDKMAARLDELFAQDVELRREEYALKDKEQRAYRDAIVGVIGKLRPMGGALKNRPVFVNDAPPASLEVINLALDKANANVREIQRLLPSDWIKDMNAAGEARIELHSKRIRGYQRFEQKRADQPGAITEQQQHEVERVVAQGGSYEGMYDGTWPVVRRPGTQVGGIGPNAPIYDWIDASGQARNIEVPAVAPPGGFDPAKWNRAAPEPQVAKLTGRGDSEIALNLQHTARTYLHEVGHRVQAVPTSNPYPGMELPNISVRHQAEVSYLIDRTNSNGTPTDAKVQKLEDVCPGQGYDPWEVTIPDEFAHPYYGKVYGNYYNQYNELLTMSLENLYYGNLLFEDPETSNWILGVLAAT